ncbi:KAT8 regulatory NSL complex subunit 1, partial [Tachysurus ichikawai]
WRRAEGRFALERASIISRWTWLQAHISDLEYRIRQHTDISRQIRTSKGSVELGDVASSYQTKTEKVKAPCATGGLSQANRSMSELFHSVTETSDVKLSPSPESGCSAARVRPLISCKRRRLVQPGMLQNLNSKCVRASVRLCVPLAVRECVPLAVRECVPLAVRECVPLAVRECVPLAVRECVPLAVRECVPLAVRECVPLAVRE